MLHLHNPNSVRESPDNKAPEGMSGAAQGLEQGSEGVVLSKDSRGFRSSGVAHGLVLAFCSQTHSAGDPEDRVDDADDTFCLRWRMMLHWRAITF